MVWCLNRERLIDVENWTIKEHADGFAAYHKNEPVCCDYCGTNINDPSPHQRIDGLLMCVNCFANYVTGNGQSQSLKVLLRDIISQRDKYKAESAEVKALKEQLRDKSLTCENCKRQCLETIRPHNREIELCISCINIEHKESEDNAVYFQRKYADSLNRMQDAARALGRNG